MRLAAADGLGNFFEGKDKLGAQGKAATETLEAAAREGARSPERPGGDGEDQEVSRPSRDAAPEADHDSFGNPTRSACWVPSLLESAVPDRYAATGTRRSWAEAPRGENQTPCST